jgi:type I restriction enzyme S subunit
LYYALSYAKRALIGDTHGGMFDTITRDTLDRLLIPVPTLNVQEQIAEILGSLDMKIEVNKAVSKTLEDIAQTIFKSWFIDFDPVKAKMAREKPAGMDDATAALFPDSMEESEFGLIPKSWKVRSLFDCGLEIESGSRPKGGVKGITSGVPSIGAESINGLGVFDFSKTKYVPRDFYDKMNKGKPQDFDILLYKDGGKPGEFKPRVGMYGLGFPFSEYGINEHVFILRAKDIGNPYLYFWIRLERTLDILRNRGVKAAIPGINQQDVGTIPILQPSKDVLKAFNELAMPSISLILTLASESMKLANLRDTVLPRLISGELQISDEMQVS